MEHPLTWAILFLISATCNVILWFALDACLARDARAPLEPKPTRTDDGEPEFAPLDFSNEPKKLTPEVLAGFLLPVKQRPPLYLGEDPTEGVGPWPGARSPIAEPPAKPTKTRRGKKAISLAKG